MSECEKSVLSVQMKTSQELNHKLKEELLRSRREYNRIHRSKPHFKKLILYNSIV